MLMQGSSGCPAGADACTLKRLQMSRSARQYATPCDSLRGNVTASAASLLVQDAAPGMQVPRLSCQRAIPCGAMHSLLGTSQIVMCRVRALASLITATKLPAALAADL